MISRVIRTTIVCIGLLALTTPVRASLIIGGEVVSQNDPIAATTVAVVVQDGLGGGLCTGSIIGQDLVVTAGHCVGTDKSNIQVVFTLDVFSKEIVSLPIKGFIRHPGYTDEPTNDKDMNDVALLRLDGALPAGYHPTALLANASDLKDNDTVVLAGYGVTTGTPNDEPSKDGAGVLRKTSAQVKQARYGTTEVLLDESHGHGTCHGDSGGPVFLSQNGELKLFGVTSRGPMDKPDDCASEGIYTNLTAHMDFLTNAARELRKLP
jgi:secreted trypsin-like serine protease